MTIDRHYEGFSPKQSYINIKRNCFVRLRTSRNVFDSSQWHFGSFNWTKF